MRKLLILIFVLLPVAAAADEECWEGEFDSAKISIPVDLPDAAAKVPIWMIPCTFADREGAVNSFISIVNERAASSQRCKTFSSLTGWRGRDGAKIRSGWRPWCNRGEEIYDIEERKRFGSEVLEFWRLTRTKDGEFLRNKKLFTLRLTP